MKLTKQQKNFLLRHDVPLSRVFDATRVGPKKTDYGSVMSKLELWVAYNVTPCKKFGHTLRIRSGHCLQCRPANLHHLKLHDMGGEVYVAYSSGGRFVKVGTSNNPNIRIRGLNGLSYGGVSDWEIKYSSYTEKAGKVEFFAQESLASYRVDDLTYLDKGRRIECLELFRCKVPNAIAAVKVALQSVCSK